MLDTLTTAGVRGDGGLRGDEAAFGTNMLMTMASRPLGRGRLHVRAMSSFEPLMGAEGYPLLLQTGETAAGVTPVIDRQHPHDLLMGLGVEYADDISPDAALFLGEALVGWSLFTRLSL